MPNDLVARLRNQYASPQDAAEAADRIEQLEAALKDMKVVEWEARHYSERVSQLAAALWKISVTPPFGEPKDIALAALGVKGEYADKVPRAALEGEDERNRL